MKFGMVRPRDFPATDDVISADSLQAATEMAKGCPVRDSGGSIEVYETFDVM